MPVDSHAQASKHVDVNNEQNINDKDAIAEHPLADLANKQEPQQLISIDGGLAKTFREVKPNTTTITTKIHREIVEALKTAREARECVLWECMGHSFDIATETNIVNIDRILAELGE